MARTSSSRGISGFKMRSGNSPMKDWKDWLKKAALGPLSLFGGGGDDDVQGVEGTIATDEQKAGLGIGGNQMGKGGKFARMHARLHAANGSGDDDISGVDLQPTALSKKYKYKNK